MSKQFYKVRDGKKPTLTVVEIAGVRVKGYCKCGNNTDVHLQLEDNLSLCYLRLNNPGAINPYIPSTTFEPDFATCPICYYLVAMDRIQNLGGI